MRSLSPRMEDYLGVILTFCEEKGYARTKDVSEALSRAPASVVQMFQRLNELGLVVYRPYEGVTLSELGWNSAHLVRRRHDLVEGFLKRIYVPDEIAHRDAHILEHQLSSTTLERIGALVDFLDGYGDGEIWTSFRRFIESE